MFLDLQLNVFRIVGDGNLLQASNAEQRLNKPPADLI